MNQDESEGMRMYYALDDNGKLTLVLVGVDSQGDDLYNGNLMEFGGLCPPDCPVENPLNK
jgi:hypothetical protein